MQNSSYHLLKSKFETRHDNIKKNLVDKHWDALNWASNNTKQIAAGALGSLLLLVSPHSNTGLLSDGASHNQFVDIPENLFLVTDLEKHLPENLGDMTHENEEEISKILSNYYGFSVKQELNGLRLKHTYGYIGAEQHLMRYPGDTMESHFDNPQDAVKYYSSGMAPGRGAYGYFAQGNALSQQEVEREKYYIAVQTFLADNYSGRTREYVDFFKYRKMLVVNPNTGRAVVVVIGDAGPAVWTGKQLGGSPEVMKHLERVDGRARGRVLYFFIDDPEDKVPLGPIDPVNNNFARLN